MSAVVPPAQYQVSRLYSSIPVRRLKDILVHIIPDHTLVEVEECNSTQVSRLYTLNMSNGEKFMLSYAPSLAVRLMRHEATLLFSEALLINFITSSRTEPATAKNFLEISSQPKLLWKLTPKLLKHSSNNRELNHPYTVFEPVTGEALSTIHTSLQEDEIRAVYTQLGIVARELARLISPTGLFGTTAEVLPDPFAMPAVPQNIRGWKTWSKAFQYLLEGVLRDGEDIGVLLPYETIRSCYQQAASILDLVQTPRLIILDIASEVNVMVETEPAGEGRRLTGLRSWSQGIFGDPLISNCFDEPSEGFLDGWHEGSEEFIEDKGNAPIRMMMYKCLRALVDIVTEHYRPNSGSSERELLARRRLTSTLADLEKVYE